MLRRSARVVGLTLGGIGILLALTAADARGTWLLFVVLSVLGLAAIWVERSLMAAAVPVLTAVAWAPLGLALADADSEWSLPLAIAICLLAALPGVLIAVLGALVFGDGGEKQLPPSHATLLLVIATVLTVGGCGGSTGPDGAGVGTANEATLAPATNATPTMTAASTAPPVASTPGASAGPPRNVPARRAPKLDEVRKRMPGGDGRPPARTLPNGAVVIPPPTPAETQQPASDACATTAIHRDGVPTSVEVPPAPGLRADVLGDAVRVTVDTGHPPAKCAPDYYSIRIQLDTDLRSPVSREVRLRQLGEQIVTIRLPDAGGSIADGVVRATTGTDTGRISPTAAIALVE